jgi:Holliday junction resolvase RusA-like endonuclease
MTQIEMTVQYEPTSLKRHRHRLKGGTYDPSKKEKDAFLSMVLNTLDQDTFVKMTKPIKCTLHFYSKRPKNHYKSGKKSEELKENAPKYNTNNKDLDNMVKFVLDALNYTLYEDDRQIIEIHCIKSYSLTNAGHIVMKFEELEP